jgi:hypothetical protein
MAHTPGRFDDDLLEVVAVMQERMHDVMVLADEMCERRRSGILASQPEWDELSRRCSIAREAIAKARNTP